MPSQTKSRPLPPAIERTRMLPTAADLRGVSVSTFKRNFGHLIRRVSPRRLAVQLGELLDEPESEPP
jgi:hypothetical protein